MKRKRHECPTYPTRCIWQQASKRAASAAAEAAPTFVWKLPSPVKRERELSPEGREGQEIKKPAAAGL